MKIHLIWIMCIHFFNRKWEWNNILCSPFVLTFCVFQVKKIFLPLSKCKMSQIKKANSRDSWILCLHSSQLSVSQDFPVFQNIKSTFSGNNSIVIFTLSSCNPGWHSNTTGSFLLFWKTCSQLIPGPCGYRMVCVICLGCFNHRHA